MRFATSLVGPDRAPDLVSEVMVATLQSRTLESLENPRAYLMQAVLNRARSSGRSLARERKALERIPSNRIQGDEPADLVINADLAAAVAGLPVQQRAAIYLVYWEDLDPTQAARLMGIRPATLRRYLFLARSKLRTWIDE